MGAVCMSALCRNCSGLLCVFGLDCLLIAAVLASGIDVGRLVVRPGAAEVESRSPAGSAAVPAAVTRGDSRHAVVRFDRPVDDSVRPRLAAAGVARQGCLGRNAWLVTLTAGAPLFQAADFDNDNDVDSHDFGVHQRCFSGTDIAADPACAQ